MTVFRRLLALVVLAFWLPATLHCSLEAAGFENVFRCASDCQAASDDSCDVVENGVIKLSTNSATLPAPFLFVSLFSQLCPRPEVPLAPPPVGISEVVAAPREVSRTWHFVARAAPAPRAPALVA